MGYKEDSQNICHEAKRTPSTSAEAGKGMFLSRIIKGTLKYLQFGKQPPVCDSVNEPAETVKAPCSLAEEDVGKEHPESPVPDRAPSAKKESSGCDVKKLLKEIRIKASWGNTEAELAELKQELLLIDSRSGARVETEINMGRLAHAAWDDSYTFGATLLPPSEFEKKLAEWEKQGLNPKEIRKCREKYEKGGIARQKSKDAQNYSPEKLPADIKDNANYIGAMQPSKKWTILFDETGKYFSDEAEKQPKSTVGKGVMLLVPHGVTLPDLEKKWHAVDKQFSEVESVICTLLQSRCAIIGIPCTALVKNGNERWFACIEALLDLILRCLPVREKTELELFVEQRGEYKGKESTLLQKTCLDSHYHLSRADRSKADKITITGRIIGKDGHPWNGYVDAVAYLWSAQSFKKVLEHTKWEARCLLGLSPGVSVNRLCSWMDYFNREHALLPEDWSNVVTEVEMQKKPSLLKSLSEQLGRQARVNANLWKQYLDYTVLHLNSKAINMRILGAQISWLKRSAPENHELPPRLRLLWLTSQLAEDNHKGCSDTYKKNRDAFQLLSEQLYEEDAPLTCDAALHVAVRYVDRFDFEGAAKFLEPWRERPAAVPGLQNYGRLMSSLGQHEAFMGNVQAAWKYFLEAFKAFARLSDKESAHSDIMQTNAYLLTLLMDLEQDIEMPFRKYGVPYFGGEIGDIAPRLAASTADRDKYKHHILLRYLHSFHATEKERAAYRSARRHWRCGEGHPWEMIEFYRACLCEDAAEKSAHLNRAYEMVRDAGGPLRVIATVIAGARLALNPDDKAEYVRQVEECRVRIPLLGDRIRILQEYADHPGEPLALARQVLPFHFR